MSTYVNDFASFGMISGPISEVSEDYVPETLIANEEFEEIYAKRASASNKELFFARDYVVKHVNELFAERADGEMCLTDVLAELPKERLSALFWGLEGCSCCWRHCHMRPISIDSEENNDMLDRVTKTMVSREANNCFCHCRMFKRSLRRAFLQPKVVWVEVVSSDDQ